MYDMRRPSTPDDPNPNYLVTRFEDLKINAFESRQNYEIVKHLYDNGWLKFYNTTAHFYLGSESVARYWCFPIEGTAKTIIDGTEYTLKDCNEPRWVKVTSKAASRFMNILPIAAEHITAQQKTELPVYKMVIGDMSDIRIPVTDMGVDTKIANCEIIEENGKKYFILNTNAISFVNLETGEVLSVDPSKTIEAGKEYIARLQLTTGADNKDLGESCEGYIFIKIQVLPQTLVWRPADTKINGWGLNENWKSWEDTNGNKQVDDGDTFGVGYVPMAGVDVIIPKIDNELRYPYIVPDNEHLEDPESDHKHNHYPLTINHDGHACRNIYFAPGAKIHNQHLLQYEKAFVDMQMTAGSWHLVSAPLQGMVSGDMFIPHNGWYDEKQNNRIAEPNPFEVKAFEGTDYQGIRHANAAYTFWEAFHESDVDGSNTLVRNFSNMKFTQSNSLKQPLNVGTGYMVYGLGHQEAEQLTVRLPKPDTEYYYYNEGKKDESSLVEIPQENRGKLAFTVDQNTEMTIVLKKQANSEYFLFGNPTMAYIDLLALYKDNIDKGWTGTYTYVQHSATAARTPILDTPDRYLPPMTSVLLTTTNGAMELSINLKPEHLTLNTQVDIANSETPNQIVARRAPVADNVASELMTINAFTEKAFATMILATNPAANDYYTSGEDALFTSSGVENKSYVTTPLNMYTVAEQVPMMADVRQGISEVPLAILAADEARANHMQLAFYLSSNWTRECYFYDSATGQSMRIMDGLIITVEMPDNHEQRYYIEGPDDYHGSSEDGGVTTSTTRPIDNNAEATLQAYSSTTNTLLITSNKLISEVKLFDLAGHMLVHQSMDLMHTSTTLPAPSGICIVTATLQDGTTIHTQALVK